MKGEVGKSRDSEMERGSTGLETAIGQRIVGSERDSGRLPDLIGQELQESPAEDEAWQDKANCLGVDPDLFFPERGASTREAKEVCRGCVVREDCLEYALAHGEKFGIWGGMQERERRRIRRARAYQRAKSSQLPHATPPNPN